MTRNNQKLIVKIRQLRPFLEQRKRVSVFRLAWEMGYSPEYFKRSVLPLLLELEDCISVEGKYVVWVCKEEETAVRALQELKAAKPVRD